MIKSYAIAVLLSLLVLSGCMGADSSIKLEKVGLLVPETINDQVWGTKGYKGMLRIQSSYSADVFYKEGMDSLSVVEQAVEDFSRKGVTLIFGHGSEYGDYFSKIAPEYPTIHFVFFNGDAMHDNITSLNFKSNAMGFFGGMVAGNMTKTNNVGVIAAYDWQPEVAGFREGALYENPNVNVHILYTDHWDNVDIAIEQLDELLNKDVDVVYPAGDGYNVPIIERLKKEGLYAIGFVSDQSDLGEATVLTSTVQHVDKLYELVASQYIAGALEPGNLYFDFQDSVISLGKFSPLVSEEYKEQLYNHIKVYKKTGMLPHETSGE
ncbi:BMP family ABC transporter substrate-binding protein [Bacillus sp. HMF5848]|uniref:BMP family ABC transporter substrate-binding protein n=1 Tax=Bacillus sp. HMF5848 TaxID=2495421 RepID=UPI000F78C0E4|nr:BMP family ABC transporter substrate-binding protein [Bacillus sp. HMF5848]RSK26460.1 BMP family ABC transporter substrate-binding protein [Bacillus sp. HMF5848]